jgi:hypothetical protein
MRLLWGHELGGGRRDAALRRLQQDLLNGDVALAFGSLLDPEDRWGLGLLDREDEQAARAVGASDPAVERGAWAPAGRYLRQRSDTARRARLLENYAALMTRSAKLAIAVAALCAAIAPAADAAKPTPTGSSAPSQVFFPNPVQSLGDGTLTDQKDANYAAIAAAYARKTLTDLDGSGTLTGAYARVESETGTPARNAGSGFIYTEVVP